MFRKKKPKILIIEDQINNHQLFTDLFSDGGFEVKIQRSADGDFVRDVVDFAPSIISMDIDIGDSLSPEHRNGLEAVCLLREDQKTKHIPIIMLTNFYDESKIERAKECGATDYITLQGQELRSVVEQFKICAKNPRKYTPNHPAFR